MHGQLVISGNILHASQITLSPALTLLISWHGKSFVPPFITFSSISILLLVQEHTNNSRNTRRVLSIKETHSVLFLCPLDYYYDYLFAT